MHELMHCIEKMFMTYLQTEKTQEMKRKLVNQVQQEFDGLLDEGYTAEDAKKFIKNKYGFETEAKSLDQRSIHSFAYNNYSREEPVYTNDSCSKEDSRFIDTSFTPDSKIQEDSRFFIHLSELQGNAAVNNSNLKEDNFILHDSPQKQEKDLFYESHFPQETHYEKRTEPKEDMSLMVKSIEEEKNVYVLLEEQCDVSFHLDENKLNFSFVCLKQFVIFAVDSQNNCFGFIDGIGDIDDTETPIGYVTADGKCGRVANNLREFLELVVYYPFWKSLDFEQLNNNYIIDEIERYCAQYNPNFIKHQKKIADTFGLHNNGQSLKLLYQNLISEPGFMVYDSGEEHRPYDNLIQYSQRRGRLLAGVSC